VQENGTFCRFDLGEALAVEQFRAACMDRSTAAAKEIRECIEGKIHEHVDLKVNVEEDVVLRLKRAHKRMQKLKAEREAKLTNASHTMNVSVITSGT
jgi:transposase-like protein